MYSERLYYFARQESHRNNFKKNPHKKMRGFKKFSEVCYFAFPSLSNFTDCVLVPFLSSTSYSPFFSL